MGESAWGNTIRMRIEAYRNLQGIVEQELASCGSGGEKLQEMPRWVQMLAGIHEKLLLEWKARGESQVIARRPPLQH
ncbi:MAG: hypothetical protein M0Z41_07180 [Peptococcaceae bacterium]|nr:hypothetical protein [Peptococcaceae bacterium]